MLYSDRTFDKAIFSKSPYYGCLFINCTFSRETFHNLHFDSCSFINCSFIEGVKILTCSFNRCSFFSLYIDNATFTRNCFTECVLANVSLRTWSRSNNIIISDCVGFFPKIPSYGSFYGYKVLQERMIARLLIPADAKRSTNSGGKCRASYAIVDEIMDCAGRPMPDEVVGYSLHDPTFEYHKGATVIPSGFTPNPTQECGEGIHFFLSFEEAKNFVH